MLTAYNARPFISGRDPKHGISPLRFTDGPRGVAVNHSTCFPVSMARGATWDTALETRVGDAMGIETRAVGANFIAAMEARKQPISDVWSHNRMLETCHLANIAIRLGRELQWDPAKREIIGDEQANSFLARENRSGYAIDL